MLCLLCVCVSQQLHTHTHTDTLQQLLTLVFLATGTTPVLLFFFFFSFRGMKLCRNKLWHTRSQGWWLRNILPITASLKPPSLRLLQLSSDADSVKSFCPPRPPIKLRHHTPPLSLKTPSSVTHPLFFSPQFYSLNQPPLVLLSSVTPDQKDLDPTWNGERLWGIISSVSQERAYKDRTNRLEKQKQQSFNFSLSVSLSLSQLVLIPLPLGAFISLLSVFCLVTYFEMLNLPPCSELIIKSEWVQGPDP